MIDKEVIDILERMAQVLEGKINGKTGEILHEHSFFTGHLPECKACWAERLVAERDALAQKVKELEEKYKEDEHIIERYVERVKWDQERVNQLTAERDALAQKVKELEDQLEINEWCGCGEMSEDLCILHGKLCVCEIRGKEKCSVHKDLPDAQ